MCHDDDTTMTLAPKCAVDVDVGCHSKIVRVLVVAARRPSVPPAAAEVPSGNA